MGRAALRRLSGALNIMLLPYLHRAFRLIVRWRRGVLNELKDWREASANEASARGRRPTPRCWPKNSGCSSGLMPRDFS